MPRLIGTDEAGYGPNFGPLVITASAWHMDCDLRTCDVWELLADVVTRTPAETNGRLHVGDSKEVYSPAKGLKSLETSVLTILAAAGCDTSSFLSLWRSVGVVHPAPDEQEPWFVDADFRLPVIADVDVIANLTERIRVCLESCGIQRPVILSDVVLTRRFNELTTQHGSKGGMLSSLSLSLLRRVWEPDDTDPAEIICDKHGGRNRYDELLADVLDGQMIFRMEEGRERSVYRIGPAEVWFQSKAESHFPVAVASLVSKYLRELAMRAFNDFWMRHIPTLRPTSGYPTDARRFRADIEAKQSELGITNHVLWRNR